MKIHRFIGNIDTSKNWIEIRDQELVHQINRVLKLRVGEQIIFGDGAGNEALGVLETVSKSLIEAKVVSHNQNTNEPKKSVTLYLAILKKDNFELAIQKAVEVGISRIVPVLTERTVKIGINEERVNTIIREAAEQSGRGIIPSLAEVVTFGQALAECTANKTFFFDLTGEPFESAQTAQATALFIGPEGGFSSEEVTLAKEAGCSIANLGPLTLRGETAAIVASYRIIHSV